MTTFAYKDGVLATDSAVSGSGTYCGSTTKGGRAQDGTLAAACGDLSGVPAILEWLEGGAQGEPPIPKDTNEYFVARPDGTCLWVGVNGAAQVHAPFHAGGSGASIALGAMAAGASAQAAVEIACDLDNSSRRPVLVFAHHAVDNSPLPV